MIRPKLTCTGLAGLALSLAVSVLVLASATQALALDVKPARGPGAGSDRSSVVKVAQGTLDGSKSASYRSWLGIPYAKPPVGDLRFRPPAEPTSWTATRSAREFGAPCAQAFGDQHRGSEDCLYLNVYAPADGGRNLPVLFYIHGGGFVSGTGQESDPAKFVEQTGVIVITLNYRLGIFGGLALPSLDGETPYGSGNYGLLDQQAALRWVQRNIGAFGGDRRRVAIAGLSAGGQSVCAHMASPTAKGLFSRAIIQSGDCAVFRSKARGHALGELAAKLLDCPTGPNQPACLRRVPASAIQALVASGAASPLWHGQPSGEPQPTVGGRAFPHVPRETFKSGAFNRVPVMNGQTHDELAPFIPGYYDPPLTEQGYADFVQAIYPQDGPKVLAQYPASQFDSPAQALTTVISDAGTTARLRDDLALSAWVPTYGYEFNAYPLADAQRDRTLTSTHGEDLAYIFDAAGSSEAKLSGPQREMARHMRAYWGAFVRAGDPNAGRSPQRPHWSHVSPKNPSWMIYQPCGPADGPRRSAGCSRSTTSYLTDHREPFWRGIQPVWYWGGNTN